MWLIATTTMIRTKNYTTILYCNNTITPGAKTVNRIFLTQINYCIISCTCYSISLGFIFFDKLLQRSAWMMPSVRLRPIHFQLSGLSAATGVQMIFYAQKRNVLFY
jgi:hypothetical protein